MTWFAPTPREIVALGGDLSVSCETCRMLRAPRGMAEELAAGRWAATPIDKLLFRCHVCGGRGKPLAKAPGNALLGRPQLWPPVDAEAPP